MPEQEDKKSSLAELVSNFSEVFFSLGRFAFASNNQAVILKESALKEALDAYRNVKERYDGDTSVYDNEINRVLDSFPDMFSDSDYVQRV